LHIGHPLTKEGTVSVQVNPLGRPYEYAHLKLGLESFYVHKNWNHLIKVVLFLLFYLFQNSFEAIEMAADRVQNADYANSSIITSFKTPMEYHHFVDSTKGS
jgi:hypothetical protein